MAPLGNATADLMEKIETVYGEDASVVDGIVVAEVAYKDDEGFACTALEYFCTSPRSVVKAGLLAIASEATTRPFVEEGNSDEDE